MRNKKLDVPNHLTHCKYLQDLVNVSCDNTFESGEIIYNQMEQALLF